MQAGVWQVTGSIASLSFIESYGIQTTRGAPLRTITMTTKAPEDEVCQSVLDFVADGAYPESEKVVASDLPVSALSKELELISKAREQVEVGVLP